MKNKIILLCICLGLCVCANAEQQFTPAVNKSAPTTKKAPQKTSAKTSQKVYYPLKITTPTHHASSNSKNHGVAAVKSANKKAVQQPKSSQYFNSIMTYDFMPGALYKVYCAPLSVTDIQLKQGEHIVSVAGGDTLRWQVSKTYSGSGPERQEHLLIKATDVGLHNSLVITTDQRTYHLLLQSLSSTYMASVQWRYPQDDNDFVQTFGNDVSSQQNMLDSQDIDLKQLDFNYLVQIVGDSKKTPTPVWMPRAVFDDGKKTYIQFPDNIQESPTLFIGGLTTGRIINYRVEGNYYVVDGVFKQMQLRSGQTDPEVVLITHK